MNEAHIQKIAGELKVQPRQVLATAKLFAEGATVKIDHRDGEFTFERIDSLESEPAGAR